MSRYIAIIGNSDPMDVSAPDFATAIAFVRSEAKGEEFSVMHPDFLSHGHLELVHYEPSNLERAILTLIKFDYRVASGLVTRRFYVYASNGYPVTLDSVSEKSIVSLAKYVEEIAY